MWLLWLALAARAEDPDADPDASLRAHAFRALGVDVPLGAPVGRWEDAHRLSLTTTDDPYLEDARQRLLDALDPELRAAGGPILVVRPRASLAEGPLVPEDANGDTEPGWLSPRLSADVSAYARLARTGAGSRAIVEARAVPEVGLDVVPGAKPSAGLPEWRLGLRTAGFHAALSQEARWFGPGRHGTLMFTDNARPVPAIDVGGDAKLPGKAAIAGRFAADVVVGVLPGERRDVDRPDWLIMDVRWLPVPWVELGATRNAVFGGVDDGVPRPIAWGQIALPTHPHVYGDPEHELADSDERASWSVRGTLPVSRLVGGPVTTVEAYLEHGGEDVISRHVGPIPVPSLAGAANVYGGEVTAGPWYADVEGAVLEDDLYRWYVGHRVYHDGWTVDGRVLGYPSGGDARTLWAAIGRDAPDGWSFEASFLREHRWLVADRLEDHLFVFPAPQVANLATARVSRTLPRGGWTSLVVTAGPVTAYDWVPGDDRWEHRVMVQFQAPLMAIARPERAVKLPR